jgi:hypothetical protein
MTDTRNPDAPRDPLDPIRHPLRLEDEWVIIESLRPEVLVERAISALLCLRDDRPDHAALALLFGRNVDI